jgi:hypothetical protein
MLGDIPRCDGFWNNAVRFPWFTRRDHLFQGDDGEERRLEPRYWTAGSLVVCGVFRLDFEWMDTEGGISPCLEQLCEAPCSACL